MASCLVALDPNSSVSERFGADVIQQWQESSRLGGIPGYRWSIARPRQITRGVVG
jgi:hypothetical protein